MTIVGLGMLLVFGFLAIRHFRNGRVFWGILAALGSLLGAASLWVDYQRATAGDEPAPVAAAPSDQDSENDSAPLIGDYDPDA